MTNQGKRMMKRIVILVVFGIALISGILGIKHIMKNQTYEKPINAVIKDEHDDLDNKNVTSKNSKIVVYDDSDEGNDYLITVTYRIKDNKSLTNQYIVDKATNHVEWQDEILPVSNLKKLYESNHLK